MPKSIEYVAGKVTAFSHAHEETHEGKYYYTAAMVAHGSELANDATFAVLLIVGDTPFHSVIHSDVGGDCEIYVSEGATASANGTVMAFINLNRVSDNVLDVVAYSGPTITDNGTVFPPMFIPGGSGPLATGLSVRRDTELIMAPNTTYLIRIINRSGSAIQASIAIEGYEDEVE